MSKPLIALTPLWDKKLSSYWMLPGYMELIIKNGGIPVMLSFAEGEEAMEKIAQTFDGFVFTGGDDIKPEYYNEERVAECADDCEERDKLEFALFKAVAKTDKPVLGICRGMQFLNVALGGTLYQDLPTMRKSDVIHRQGQPYDGDIHTVDIYKDSLLHKIVNQDTINVNSLHHQAVKDLGEGLKACAIASDGLVEAVCHPDKKFFLGVQWHPEMRFAKDKHSMEIGKAFVDACRE